MSDTEEDVAARLEALEALLSASLDVNSSTAPLAADSGPGEETGPPTKRRKVEDGASAELEEDRNMPFRLFSSSAPRIIVLEDLEDPAKVSWNAIPSKRIIDVADEAASVRKERRKRIKTIVVREGDVKISGALIPPGKPKGKQVHRLLAHKPPAKGKVAAKASTFPAYAVLDTAPAPSHKPSETLGNAPIPTVKSVKRSTLLRRARRQRHSQRLRPKASDSDPAFPVVLRSLPRNFTPPPIVQGGPLVAKAGRSKRPSKKWRAYDRERKGEVKQLKKEAASLPF